MGFLDEIEKKDAPGRTSRVTTRVMARTTTTATMTATTMAIRTTATVVLRARASTPKTSRATACLARRAAVKLSRLPCIRAPVSWSAMTPAMPRRITRLRARRTVLRAVIVLVPMTRRRAMPRIPAPVPPLHPRLHRAMPRPMRAISSTPRRSCRPMSCAPRAMTTWRPWCAAFAPSSLSH